RINDGDVRARTQLQVIIRRNVRCTHELDLTRIDDDQLRTLTEATLELRAEHRMRLGWVRADHHDHVRLHDRRKLLCARRFPERVLEAITRRRMAHACARIDIVVAECSTHELLYEERLFVRAT